MNSRGMITATMIGLVLLFFVFRLFGGDAESYRWVGREAAEIYAAGKYHEVVDFSVNVAGVHAANRALIALGEQGGLASASCYDKTIDLFVWGENCEYTDLQQIQDALSLLFTKYFAEEADIQFAQLPFSVKFDSNFNVGVSASKGEVTFSAVGEPLVYEAEGYVVRQDLRFKDQVRYPLAHYLEIRQKLVDNALCLSMGDVAGCVPAEWQASKRGDFIFIGIPGPTLDRGERIFVRFAITLNSLNALAGETSSKSLFGETA